MSAVLLVLALAASAGMSVAGWRISVGWAADEDAGSTLPDTQPWPAPR